MNQLKSIHNSSFKNLHSHPHSHLFPIIASNGVTRSVKFEFENHVGYYIPQSLGDVDPIDLVEFDVLLVQSVQESELGSVAYVP